MTLEIPDTPPEMAAWLETQELVINELAKPLILDPGNHAVSLKGAVVMVGANAADAITFCLGRYVLAHAAQMHRAMAQAAKDEG